MNLMKMFNERHIDVDNDSTQVEPKKKEKIEV